MSNIFISAEHKARFLWVMKPLEKRDGTRFDSEYASAIYILTAHALNWKSASDYVSREGIRFSDMLEEVYHSTGEETLVKLAANLFGHDITVNPVDFMYLDDNNFKLAMNAIQIRRYSLHEDQI